jgi:ABC-2 type transport system permease protein
MRSFFIAFLELRLFLQDKGSLAFSLLLPIVIFALMYGAFGGGGNLNITATMVDQDPGGAYATLLLERLQSTEGLTVQLVSEEEAQNKLERADLWLIIYIPPGFSDQLSRGETATLLFKQRGNGGQEGQIAAGMVRGAAEAIGQDIQVKDQVQAKLSGSGISPAHIDTVVEKYLARNQTAPVVSVSDNILGETPDPVKSFLPGVVTMFVLFSITLTARTLVEERKRGTLERLLSTRLDVNELFSGKFMANTLRGFLQTLILFLLAYAVFQLFTPLSFFQSLFIAVLFSAAATALGLVIGTLARSENQAVWIAVFFTVAMSMIGGTFFTIEPGSVLATISHFSLNTYANDAFKVVINQSGSLASVGLDLAILAGVTVVLVILSRVFFRVLPGGK